MVTKMIGIGERSGSLDALLEKIGEFYDQQVEAEVKGLTSLIEPIMISVMGIIVGGIVPRCSCRSSSCSPSSQAAEPACRPSPAGLSPQRHSP